MATMSSGTYRIPYRTGTSVKVTGDHLTHEPPTRIDMHGVGGGEPYRIAAAADGVVRFIVDRFSEQRPDGDPCNNNYVWIEHDNGEWTKYSHMTRRSVTRDAGLSVGERVTAGTFLGFEGAVGCASGEHLHFEVGVPADPDDPIDDDGFLRGGFARNRIPRICGVAGQRFVDGETYRAANCAAVIIRPTVVTFGSVRPGESSRRTITVTNLSGRVLTLALQPSPTGSVFTWRGFDRRVDHGSETSFQVTFTARSNAIERTTLRLTSNAPGSPHAVGLTGKGVGGIPPPEPEPDLPDELELRPRLLSFGGVARGDSRTMAVTIRNPTGVPVEVTVAPSSGGVFSWPALDAVVPHGQERRLNVTFSPVSSAIVQGTVLVRSTAAGSPQPVALTGKGPGGFPVPTDTAPISVKGP